MQTDEEPEIPGMNLPAATGPLRERAAIVRCVQPGCNVPLLYETEKLRGTCAPCFDRMRGA